MTHPLIAVGAALLLAVGAAAPAVAQPAQPRAFGAPVYLALGDSIAAGVGAQPHVTGYPEQVRALLEQAYNPFANKATPNSSPNIGIINLAVGGATTTTLIATQLSDAIELIDHRQADRDPFNNVEVLSVTIGGNDIFAPAVAACVLTTDPSGCQPSVDAVLAATHTNLTTILERLTTAAGRGTEVVVTTYDNPIGSCFLTQLNPAAPAISDVVLEGGIVPDLLRLPDGLNDVIRGSAAATGAQVANLYGLLEPHQFVGGRDCLHPNLVGHTRIAEVVYDTLAD
jgi:lysophospholipase L1-like esterase